MIDDVCLTVDLGTGGPKIGLVTFDGRILATELHATTTTRSPGGGATQDANEWWRLVRDGARRLLAADRSRAARVRAVAIAGMWATTVPVDEAGDPVGPAILWSDTRGHLVAKEQFAGPVAGYKVRTLLEFVRRSGGAPDLAGADTIGHALYLAREEPETYQRARWLLEPVDFLTMRFTGVASSTHASMQASWLLDTRTLHRMDYDETLCRLAGVDSSKLAPLRPIGDIVGTVRDDVASDLGLPAGVVAITGFPDLHAATAGSGGVRLYDTHVALSTSSWISCPVPKKKTDIFHQQATVAGLDNDSYLIVNSQDTGAKSLEWLRATTQLGPGVPPSFDDLCALAALSPPGARGVLFTPWLDGERSPVGDHGARGGFRGLSVRNEPGDLVRAVLEGVALNSRWLFRYVEKFTTRRIDQVRLLGGGAQSALWCQIYADVLDRDVIQTPQPMFAQLRGMAALAGVALGELRLLDLPNVLPAGQRFEPRPEHRARYDTLADLPAATHRAERKIVRTLRLTANR